MPRLAPYALAGAAGLSAVALYDALVTGLTGHSSAISETYGVTAVWVASSLIHLGAYLVLAAVLVVHGSGADAGSQVRRLLRWALTLSLLACAAMVLWSTVTGVATGQLAPPPVPLAVVGFVGFIGTFLFSGLLGLTLLRRPSFRTAGWVLAGTLPALGLAMLLGAVGSPFAHPAYAEATSAIGIALIALAGADPRREAADGRGTAWRRSAPGTPVREVV